MQQVAWICRALEGMPLAIVLAASWVEILSLQEIGAEIVRSLDFLSAELGDLPHRQWSVRAVLETAWQRLTPREQSIFMQLSIFQGGFTRDAAQAVAGADLAVLKSLVNGSLVSREAHGRYVIHELLCKYAHEQLERTGQFSAVAQAHAAYYLALAEQGNRALAGPDLRIWLDRLDAECDNFRAVFEWSLSGADIELGAQLAGALALYWRRRAHYLEATSTGERALALVGDESAEAHLALHLMLGSIYEPLADYERVHSSLSRPACKSPRPVVKPPPPPSPSTASAASPGVRDATRSQSSMQSTACKPPKRQATSAALDAFFTKWVCWQVITETPRVP